MVYEQEWQNLDSIRSITIKHNAHKILPYDSSISLVIEELFRHVFGRDTRECPH